jgi:multicomponent Na+:H+ antiporter subunit E
MAPEHRPSSMMSGRDRLLWARQVFTVLALLWLALSGLRYPIPGLLAALAGAAVAAWLATIAPRPLTPLRLAAFALFFLVESMRGGLDVAWRALHPALPIEPQFHRFRLELPSGQPRALLVSALSMMPGTLSAELEDGGETLVVHALTGGAMTSVALLHARVRRLFGLPDDGGHAAGEVA